MAGTDLVVDRTDPLAWLDDGLCSQTDPEAFFPDNGASSRAAKQVCQACEVRAECLQYALDHNISFGVWGGLTDRERRRLTRNNPSR
jgi:WhiB family redox-sensing transcriptional regulator